MKSKVKCTGSAPKDPSGKIMQGMMLEGKGMVPYGKTETIPAPGPAKRQKARGGGAAKRGLSFTG